MPVTDDNSSFDERLGQWISSQGFWFQLRYGSGRSGVRGLFSRLLHIMARLGVVVLLALGVAVVFLIKRTETQSFQDALPDAAAKALTAESVEIKGFQREGGRVYIHRLTAEGGQASFFYNLEAREIRYDMGLLDGLVGTWDAGPVTMRVARIEVKAGAESEEEASAVADTLFGEHDWFEFPMIEVLHATVLWGYSARTSGMITDSHMIAQRDGDGWQLTFRGGKFSQNWLKRLEINEMIVKIVPGAMRIEKAEFRRGDGQVNLKCFVKGGTNPELEGDLKFERLPMNAILPREARVFVDGTISGDGKISGSTNSQNGVGFDCRVLLGVDDQLVLRDRVPLLEALSVVDIYNSYRKVAFLKGGFHMVTGAGRLSLDNVDLEAPDLMRLRGRLVARPPTEEEIAAALAEKPGERKAEIMNALIGANNAEQDTSADSEEGDDNEITLRRAAEASREDDATGIAAAPSVGMMNPGLMPMTMEQQARNRYARLLRFEGGFEIEIPGDAFDRARILREAHPVDPTSGKIRLEVPIEGNLFDLTYKQAMEIYSKGKHNQ